MKRILHNWLLFAGLILCCSACADTRTTKTKASKAGSSLEQSNVFVDSRDGEQYAFVQIGQQIWMAENLRYKSSRSLINPDNPSSKYGRLYTGTEVQKLCPDGWHLPSDSEWNELEVSLGLLMKDAANKGWRGKQATKLKSVSGWINNGNGNNKSGFNAVPAGFYFAGEYNGLGSSTGFWSATDTTRNSAWLRFLGAPMNGINRYSDDFSEDNAVSCRCVKD